MKGNSIRQSLIFLSACGIFSEIVMPKNTIWSLYEAVADKGNNKQTFGVLVFAGELIDHYC